MLPPSIVLAIAILTVFLALVVGLKYAVQDNFTRTRIGMTAFFVFIVVTLTISFWEHALVTLPFTVPSAIVGIIIGYVLGVRTEQQKLAMHGLEYYMDHFAHIHLSDFMHLTWWSFINFYSVMGALALINLVGLTNVIFAGSESLTELLAICSSVFGAFLIGSIVPYLLHLWSIRLGRKPRLSEKIKGW